MVVFLEEVGEKAEGGWGGGFSPLTIGTQYTQIYIVVCPEGVGLKREQKENPVSLQGFYFMSKLF